jgi:hypothetical protein
MSDKPRESEDAPEKPSVTLPGKVEKIIPELFQRCPIKRRLQSKERKISTKRFASKIACKMRMASPYA